MPMPATIRVKLSSEAAEAISITPVVVQEMAVRDLVERILGLTGKDLARICELLRRGSLVSGASRFRWDGWEADESGLKELLASFPDADPARPFMVERCVKAFLRGGRAPLEITRDAGAQKGLFQRKGFWDELMAVIQSGNVTYSTYSYRDRTDRYVRELSLDEAARIRAASDAVRFSTLRDQIKTAGFNQAELLVTR